MSSDPAMARTGQGNAGRRSHSGSWVPVPHNRREEANPPALLRRRSERWASPSTSSRSKRRPAQPRVDEPLDVPRGFELTGQVLVGAAPTFTFGRVLNACRDPDEDGMAQGQFGVDAHMQRHPGTERIAEEGARLAGHLLPHRFRHQTCCRREIGAHRTGIAVSRQIHRHQGVRLGHEVPERSPQAPGLGEAVQQDQRRPGAAHLDVEWHVG